jgi:hypothetical protein
MLPLLPVFVLLLTDIGYPISGRLHSRYDQYADAWDTSVTINIDGDTVRFFHTREKGVDRVWVDHECFLVKVPINHMRSHCTECTLW